MPTVSLLFYLLTVGCAWLFRLTYLGWFGQFLFSCVVAVPILLFLLSVPSMLRLRLALSAPDTCSKNSTAELKLHFENRALFPVSRVTVWIETENRFTGEIDKQRHIFRNVGTGQYALALPTGDCGLLSCRIIRFEVRDLMGLLAFRRKHRENCKCTVLPLPVEADNPVNLDSSLSTTVRLKPKYGGGYAEDHDLREYQPGDTVNSIHWKLSSKMDDVIVREPLINANDQIYLVLSRVGTDDRGLEVLRWLSLELCQREMAHVIIADQAYPVGNEQEGAAALSKLLSAPLGEPCAFDGSNARCIFRIFAGEVRVL